MNILVQKFGGSSLTTYEKRCHAVQRIKEAVNEGYKVCVVVSAMGRKGDPYATDTLLGLIKENGDSLGKREKDLLLCCGETISAATLASMLGKDNIGAAVLTGGQAGILTDNNFGNARIVAVNPARVLTEFQKYPVVIVTGFQGMTKDGEFTTLGRGGSDTTAVALGVALNASMVDIFTDVKGIMTADPNIVDDAQPLQLVTYLEICNMAYQGAKVIHPRAVEIAMHGGVPLRVRSTFSDDFGTLVTNRGDRDDQIELMHDRPITGIAHVPNITQIKVKARTGQFDLQVKVFKAMAENDISVDFINVNPSGVCYTVHDDLADKAVQILADMGYEPEVTRNCAKVSAVGAGMAGVPGIMAMIAEALSMKDIQILQSADSHTTIWVLVKQEDMIEAVRVLHRKFNLHIPH